MRRPLQTLPGNLFTYNASCNYGKNVLVYKGMCGILPFLLHSFPFAEILEGFVSKKLQAEKRLAEYRMDFYDLCSQ